MTATSQLTVNKAVVVDAPIEKAFRVFTERLDRWWIRGHHIGTADLQRAVLECREGGRWYEIGVDGSECEWGRVLAWEPPARLVLAWQISANWGYDPDLLTEVEVRFIEDGPNRTRVELEHRHLERYGDDAERISTSVGSTGGWQALLEAFAKEAAA